MKTVLNKIKKFCLDGGTDNSPSNDSMAAYTDVSKFCDDLIAEQDAISTQPDVKDGVKEYLCPSCNKNPASDPHSCPYAEDIDNNDDPEYCTCCSDCTDEHAMDI